jgi:AAA domain
LPKLLIVVNGTMGVGKSAVCRQLVEILPGSTAWLDGDWCWTMHPFRVTEEHKRMVEDNIAHVLRSFLTSPSFDSVVFCWVIHERAILDRLLGRLADIDFGLWWYTLVADAASIRERMLADGRTEDSVARSVERLPLYDAQPSLKIDTVGRSVVQIADEIRRRALEEGSFALSGETT